MKKLNLVALAVLASAIAQPSQSFAFRFDPNNTWTNGTVRFWLFTNGFIRGNYDPVNNPNGTQTKLGVGSVFGPNQNDNISSVPFFEIGHAAVIRTGGSFHLTVDTQAKTVELSDYVADRVPLENLSLNATVALNNLAFVTKAPTWQFPAYLAPQNLGMVTVDKFTITQKAGTRMGAIALLTNGDYRVSLNFMADVQLNVVQFGQSVPMTFTVPYSLVGKAKRPTGTPPANDVASWGASGVAMVRPPSSPATGT